MKNTITKVVIFALVAIMLFGTVAASAYESYDTYTYSIDGEPLKSPHAYTPDTVTYNSKVMNLLGGNYWHYDTTGDVVVWPQRESNSAPDFTSNLNYELNEAGDGYVVVGYAGTLLERAVNIVLGIDEIVASYKRRYPSVSNSVSVGLDASEVVNEDGSYVAADELVEAVEATLADKIDEASKDPANAGKSVSVGNVDTASLKKLAYELLGLANVYLEIPATYNMLPVVGIADGFTDVEALPAVEGEGADAINAAVKAVAADVFAEIKAVFVGKNVASVGANAFVGAASLTEVYYEGVSEGDWGLISVSSVGNDTLSRATRYCYSETERFGNLALNGASDVVTDHEGNVYIADKYNNRIVILNNRDLKVMGIISTYIDENNKDRVLNSPSGVFVTDPTLMVDGSSHIYVCNTAEKSIVVFDKDYNYVRTIEQPPIAGMIDESEFDPVAVAVDKYGRIFVVSKSCYKGIIVMSNEGVFTGFIGAQKVTADIMDQIWKSFQTLEQKQSAILKLPDPFNNLTVDENGFVYATINFSKESDLKQQQTNMKTKQPAYSPVKKLNSMGIEIMKRNGFYDPSGEVINGLDLKQKVSKIIDVAIGDEGSWTILDSERQRTFTYDRNGNLLFAFGNSGNQLGNSSGCIALAYQPVLNPGEEAFVDYKYNMIILDKGEMGEYLTVYHPTEYCELIMKALHNENDHKFDATINYWQDVLTRNNNFDLAYIGIGKALYNLGEFEEAMKMLESAYETEYYAQAFAAIRKDILSKWMLPLIIGVIALLLLFFKFLGYAKKRNKATSLKVGKKTYVEELLYTFHLIFHPFDGFWDLKHEKRGSVRAGSTILAVTIVAFFYQAIGTGYMHNPKGDYSTVFLQIIAVLVPVILWIVGNWCLTTLFDGEGSFKDIYIATTYSLAPLPLFVILSTILSNVLTISEGSIVTLLVSIGYVWVGILLFFGMVVTHDYTTGKNVITTLGTIVAMAVIMFIVILFSSLVMKMATFLISFGTEIINRFV